ncbi:PREDICTED: E3 ubiquitin-protein ligase RBBP6-like [Chaetura pelagica]|uniref:E3 ubiquitin-protein ligase RBBP6-like n=1 Tax=Chaetura pelagica TaxID=8897 RepID=UPI000523C089|nr:PREDICTED: E3 ubiquitin-protein ligase RBBP6-like [Chaetura pelagica]
MSHVYCKFFRLNYATVTFSSLYISLHNLKSQIMGHEKLKVTSCALQVTNAQRRTVAIINRIITSLVILGMMILFSMGALYVYSYTAGPSGTTPKVNGTVHVGQDAVLLTATPCPQNEGCPRAKQLSSDPEKKGLGIRGVSHEPVVCAQSSKASCK